MKGAFYVAEKTIGNKRVICQLCTCLPSAFAETVSTINKSGEDYDTLTLWEDAKDGDLIPHLTTVQKDQLIAFMDMLWTKAEDEILP